MKARHQHGPDSSSRMTPRYKELVDITTGLNIRITDDLIIKFGNERTVSPNSIDPFFQIKIHRCPSVDLLGRVVTRSHFVDRSEENVKESDFITESKSTNLHDDFVSKYSRS